MNVRDVIQLKDVSIIGDKIWFVRQKTKNTAKVETPIHVPITSHMQHVIDKYGTNGKYIFDVINDKMPEADKVKACDRFVTFINDGMERLAKQCGVTASVTTYAARHSFGTQAIRNGAPMALIQESFGHRSLATTQNYFAGFDDAAKRNVSDNLMNFKNEI
jgi:integrase